MDMVVKNRFERMGARARVQSVERLGWRELPVIVDIGRDDTGEYFDIRHDRRIHLEALDVQPRDRHLVLRATGQQRGEPVDSRFLCGHDEQSWFVAAVPESARTETVQQAMDALKPPEVWASIREHELPMWRRNQRKTKAFVRQGEWFFIPRPRFNPSKVHVVRDEPISRGGGKPHLCQFLVRNNGELVYVNVSHPNGVTPAEFERLPKRVRQGHGWEKRYRNARVYVKGAVRHPDHKTIWLQGWHEVVMNTETQARAMREVAFLD